MDGFRKALRVLLPLVVLAAGVFGFKKLSAMREKPKAKPPVELAQPVEVTEAARVDAPVRVLAQGTLTPAREVALQPEVTGRVQKVHERLVRGGQVAEGEVLVEIDGRDYQLALDQRRADVERAKFQLAEEKGRGAVAESEWKLLGEQAPSDDAGRAFALREPHRRNAEASLKAAEAAMKAARLAVERTKIAAPFNAVVRGEQAEVGQVLRPGQTFATLAGTDAWWVQVAVPAADLAWIDVPGATAAVRYDLGDGRAIERTGAVVRVLPDVDPQGLMARLVVEVADPLNLKGGDRSQALLLDTVVQVEIRGRQLEGLRAIPRVALRDGDTVWLVGADDTLQIVPVQVAYRERDRVLVRDDLPPDARVVRSRLAAPVPGMKLVVAGAPAAEPAATARVGAAQP